MFTGTSAWTLAAIAEHARARPRAPAVADAAGTTTYGELWALAGTVAEALAGTRGAHIAIATGRGRPFIVAALGAWRARRAYVPVDLLNPHARLRLMMDDARPAVVAVSEDTAGIGAALGLPELVVPTMAGATEPPDPLPGPVPDDDPVAYTIYTSGTTGVPKGVVVGHRSLGNLCRFMIQRYGVGPEDRTLHVCSVGFDVSALEIWPTLAAGGSVVACSDVERMRPEAVAARADRHSCTLAMYPTALAMAALKADLVPTSLRLLMTGGDRLVLPAAPPRQPLLVNVYGPTEATVIVITYEVTDGVAGDVPPIGRPIDGVRVRLCDSFGDEVAAGEPGELYIGGAAPAHGYLNRPDLTAQRFVALPGSPDRWYRTGDLARWDAGELTFLGRVDQEQLKVRGVRVEAGEIEAALLSHEQVRSAAVVTVETELVAMLVPLGDQPSDRSLRRHLLGRLPASLLPDRFVAVDRLPLTTNGKLDRAELAMLAAGFV